MFGYLATWWYTALIISIYESRSNSSPLDYSSESHCIPFWGELSHMSHPEGLLVLVYLHFHIFITHISLVWYVLFQRILVMGYLEHLLQRIILRFICSRVVILPSHSHSSYEIMMIWMTILFSQLNRKSFSKTILIHGVSWAIGEKIVYYHRFSRRINIQKYHSE